MHLTLLSSRVLWIQREKDAQVSSPDLARETGFSTGHLPHWQLRHRYLVAVVSPRSDATFSPGASRTWTESWGRFWKSSEKHSGVLLYSLNLKTWFHLNKGSPALSQEVQQHPFGFEFLRECSSNETCRKPGESPITCYSKDQDKICGQ